KRTFYELRNAIQAQLKTRPMTCHELTKGIPKARHQTIKEHLLHLQALGVLNSFMLEGKNYYRLTR
ncbi:MAG: hypothetical protein KKE71_04165, partial [Nanoarchaeota archaeon]|nr:hypothetical protein [Nanoarchaeota archaeon]